MLTVRRAPRRPGSSASARARAAAALSCCLLPLLLACRFPTTATVENASRERLSGVVVSGEGFQAPLGALGPGESRRVALPLRSSEYGFLDVRFHAAGSPRRARLQVYFEARGYDVRVSIRPDLSVSSSVRLGAAGPALPGPPPAPGPERLSFRPETS